MSSLESDDLESSDSELSTVEALIEAVRQHPCLWDNRIKEYKNRNRKEKAWKTVSGEVNAEPDCCRKDWKSLRDRYVRERRTLQKNSRSGAAASKTPTWALYDTLAFLKDTVQHRSTSGNFSKATGSSNAVKRKAHTNKRRQQKEDGPDQDSGTDSSADNDDGEEDEDAEDAAVPISDGDVSPPPSPTPPPSPARLPESGASQGPTRRKGSTTAGSQIYLCSEKPSHCSAKASSSDSTSRSAKGSTAKPKQCKRIQPGVSGKSLAQGKRKASSSPSVELELLKVARNIQQGMAEEDRKHSPHAGQRQQSEDCKTAGTVYEESEDHFGREVALTLGAFPPKKKAFAKFKIQQILMEVEFMDMPPFPLSSSQLQPPLPQSPLQQSVLQQPPPPQPPVQQLPQQQPRQSYSADYNTRPTADHESATQQSSLPSQLNGYDRLGPMRSDNVWKPM